MHTINAHFQRLSDCSVTCLFGEIGVYVLWDGQAKVRPSYIGEGVILKRPAFEHSDRFAMPLDGYAALLAGTSQRATADAEIVETLLLTVAEHTDREPAINVAPGKALGIQDLFRSHGTIRVKVSGLDPLIHPGIPRRLTGAKRIVVRDDGRGHAAVEHDWRRRRKVSV